MHKKLIMACMAIAAFAAFVVAPAASASPVLTHEGKAVPKGTLVTATNTGETLFTGAGGVTARCTHATLTGEVTKNESNVVEGKILAANAKFNGTGTETDCTSNLFNASVGVTVSSNLCLKVSASPAHTVVTTGCGANIVFVLNFTNVATCKYTAAEVKGTFLTTADPVTVSEQSATLSEGGFACPGTGKLDMVFDLYTDNGSDPEHKSPLTIT